MVRLVESMADDHPGTAALIVSNNPKAGGIAKAEALGVPVAVVPHKGRPRAAFEAALDAALRDAQIDVICLAGFMRILSADFVARWEGKILNIHPSLLPLFKGLNTHAQALTSGMAVHGCTVHLVTAALDGGPILGQAVVPVRTGDTAPSLAARLLPLEHRLYPAVLRAFLKGATEKTVILEN